MVKRGDDNFPGRKAAVGKMLCMRQKPPGFSLCHYLWHVGHHLEQHHNSIEVIEVICREQSLVIQIGLTRQPLKISVREHLCDCAIHG